MLEDIADVRAIGIKLEKLSEDNNMESLIGSMTDLFKELRRNCTSESFRQEISANPKIFLCSLKIISKVTHFPFTWPKELKMADSSRIWERSVSKVELEKNVSMEGCSLGENSLNHSQMFEETRNISVDCSATPEGGEKLMPKLSDEVISFSVLVMQFLANAIVQFPQSQLTLWRYSKDFLVNLVYYPETRLQEVIGAIIYYIFKGCPPLRGEIIRNHALMSAGVDLLRTANTEFWYIFFEYLVTKGTNFGACFFNISSDGKLTLIELVENVLDADTSEFSRNQKMNVLVSTDVITCFIQEFNKNSDLILVSTSKGRKDVNPIEVVNLLRVLCKISANPSHMKQLQSNRSLLINCVYLLRALHDASCDPSSSVSAVKKVEDTIKERPRLEASFTYGLKADMIRIIGNLMHKNKGNQDFVRENKGIDIILESTCYDGRNPFIKEWSILAIRNFCDENESNQMYISNLQKIVKLSKDFEKGLNSSVENEASNLQDAVEFFKHMDS